MSSRFSVHRHHGIGVPPMFGKRVCNHTTTFRRTRARTVARTSRPPSRQTYKRQSDDTSAFPPSEFPSNPWPLL